MGKRILYDCDHCKQDTALDDLKAITAHIYDDNGADPRVLEMEYVCSSCRADLSKLLKYWKDTGHLDRILPKEEPERQ